jgi:hypothetical protein
MLNVFKLIVVMLSVIRLNVVMLSVVAPICGTVNLPILPLKQMGCLSLLAK